MRLVDFARFVPIRHAVRSEHASLESIRVIEALIESDRSADPDKSQRGDLQKDLALYKASQLSTDVRTVDHRRQRNQQRPAAKLPAVINVLPISGIGPDQRHHQWNWHGLPMESTGRDRPTPDVRVRRRAAR